MKKKTIFILLSIVIFIIISVTVVSNYKTIRYLIPNSIKENLPTSLLLFHEDVMVPLQTRINAFKNHNYFYNVVLLPETHFTSMEIKRYSLQNNLNIKDRIFSKEKTQYFLDLYEDNVFVTSAEANLFFFKQNDVNSNNSELTLDKIIQI